MNNEFRIIISDTIRWKPSDSEGQHSLVESLISECNKIEAGQLNLVRSGLMVNNSEAEIANALLSGLSIPALLTSAGYLLKHLSPLIVQYMKSRAQKEITVDISGNRITVKGGTNFEEDLKKIVAQAEGINSDDELS